ncbi:tumor necrosis factor receptor superfamily member 16-like [Branchiostoma floridae]|uniref:Tumor necrosis factor receptor superfamily member 16-like n=1 Tax=Branchiostoma floridae TaxID=7739 RepID=A0A9J7KKB5_BRAFL|nr:tumor necrosis factor receptor superfamily member 16-like [Branchiostoma floridae]
MEWECELCDPGYFMVSPCADGLRNSTLCEMCKGRTFTPTHNNETSCVRCREPNHVVYSEEDTPIACRCAKGFHKRHSTCVRNAFCRPGKGIHRGGCQHCPEGQFSNQYSNTQHCRPWTNCTAKGMITMSEGTSRRDVICRDTSAMRGRRRHYRKQTMDAEKETVISTTQAPANTSERKILRQKGIAVAPTSSLKVIATTTTMITQSKTSDPRSQIAEISPAVSKDDPTHWLIIITIAVIMLLLLVIVMQITICQRGLREKTSKRKVTCRPKQESRDGEKSPVHHRAVLMSDEQIQVQEEPFEVPTSPTEFEGHLHVNEPPPYHSQDLQVINNCNCNCNSHENWDDTPENQDYEGEETSPKTHIPLGFSVSMEFAKTPLAHSSESLSSTHVSSASWQTSPSSVAYRKRIQERLAQVVTNVLSRSAMEHLVGGLGREWQALAQCLGLTPAEIDHILNENRSDLDKQIYEMIRRWQQGRTGEASISELYGALLECNMEELHNKLVSLEGAGAGCKTETIIQ